MAIQFTGLASGMDTQSIVNELMAVERTKVDDIRKDKIRTEWEKDAWAEMNTKLYSFYKEELFSFKSTGTYSQKSLKSSNESVVSINDGSTASNGAHSIEVTNMAKGSFITGSEISATADTTVDTLFDFTGPLTINIKSGTADAFGVDNEITINETDTISDVLDKIKGLDLGIDVNFDEGFKRIFMSSQETGDDVQLSITGNGNGDAESLLSAMGLTVAGGTVDGSVGEDAVFKYNGTELRSDTNEVSLNGLKFTINAESGTSTLAVSTDVDAIYDKILAFVDKYNEIMDVMNTKLSAASARGYEPLTSDEKSAMTDDEIKLWETKVKDSLLRNDRILGGLRTDIRMKLTVADGVDTSGMTYKSLSELGIVTGNYTEKGKLHIHGNEDDELYAIKTNLLREALEDDPDAVMELFTAVGQELYQTMADKMSSSSTSSALTFYNNKSMDAQMDSYDDSILRLEARLAKVEERYYKQFTAMEQAIQKSNSTGDWLAQQLGGM